jgi:serine/threonine-protein kinase ATR
VISHQNTEDVSAYLLDPGRIRLKEFYHKKKNPTEYLVQALENYGKSLQYGQKHIFQSLPRMLTLWFGDDIPRSDDQKEKLSSSDFERANDLMKGFCQKLPPSIWLTCLPQLVSRMTHPEHTILPILDNILSSILEKFPGQAFWGFISTAHSHSKERVARANQVRQRAAQNRESANILNDSELLSKNLEALAMYNFDVKTSWKLRLSEFFPELLRWKGEALLPLQSQLITNSSSQGSTATGPRLSSSVYIVGFEDTFELIRSLQKPRKILAKGSDGKLYPLLVKKDTLRKDARIMEFNDVMNKLLQRVPDSRNKNLRIRTYAVVPLNEDCGVVEWVQHMNSLRGICLQEKEISDDFKDDMKKIERIWKSKIPPVKKFESACAIFQTVFHHWFLSKFSDPMAWLNARTVCSRSLAVMSMVGGVVGLGDRHGENILIETTTGECMHVDFNCLFWRGLEFTVPERVPFRLTPNLVDGMGCTGYLGTFKKACVNTLQILRHNKDTLLSVLETLVHDPLAEWEKTKEVKSSSSSRSKRSNETNNKGASHARTIIRKVSEILEGYSNSLLPLSVEGQVETLIQEATNPKNLGQMFLGWSSYM